MPNHPIPPDSYGFILDHCYADVRRWVYTGKIAPDFRKFAWMLDMAGDVIRPWVHHNETHRKMSREPNQRNDWPLIRYIDYWDQVVLIEKAATSN